MQLVVHFKPFRQQILGICLVALGAICFSAKAVFVKYVYQYQVDSVTLMALRMAMALPFYLAILLISQAKLPSVKLTGSLLAKIGFLGILCYYLANYLDLLGLQYIPANLERLILYLYPTFVMLISAIFLKQRMLFAEILVLIISYIGIGLVFIPNFNLLGQSSLIGAGFVLGSALAFAIFFIGSERYIPTIGSVRFTCYAMLAASLMILCHFLLVRDINALILPYQAYLIIFIIAVVSTVISSFLVAAGLRRLGARQASIISIIGPLSTVILAYYLLDESLMLMQIIGMFCVLLSIVFITLLRMPKRKFD